MMTGLLQAKWTCHRPANLENVFRGTFRVKKRDLPAKSGTVGRAHIEILQPTEINCVPKYTVVYSTVIRPRYRLVFLRDIERQRYKLRARKKKSDFVQKAGHFHDLAGRGTSGKKAGLSRQKRDGWQVWCHNCLGTL